MRVLGSREMLEGKTRAGLGGGGASCIPGWLETGAESCERAEERPRPTGGEIDDRSRPCSSDGIDRGVLTASMLVEHLLAVAPLDDDNLACMGCCSYTGVGSGLLRGTAFRMERGQVAG